MAESRLVAQRGKWRIPRLKYQFVLLRCHLHDRLSRGDYASDRVDSEFVHNA